MLTFGLYLPRNGGTLTGEMRLLSLNPGRREHFGGENAPSVPKSGTEGALWQGKCAFCPLIRDGGSTCIENIRIELLVDEKSWTYI